MLVIMDGHTSAHTFAAIKPLKNRGLQMENLIKPSHTRYSNQKLPWHQGQR
jgi:hypothetical protein